MFSHVVGKYKSCLNTYGLNHLEKPWCHLQILLLHLLLQVIIRQHINNANRNERGWIYEYLCTYFPFCITRSATRVHCIEFIVSFGSKIWLSALWCDGSTKTSQVSSKAVWDLWQEAELPFIIWPAPVWTHTGTVAKWTPSDKKTQKRPKHSSGNTSETHCRNKWKTRWKSGLTSRLGGRVSEPRRKTDWKEVWRNK